MPFDLNIMANQLRGMRDMNPVRFNYKGQNYTGFRDILASDMQLSLYGAHDAISITIGLPRADLKAEIEKGEPVTVYLPYFGPNGTELWILGIREDAAGLSVRMDLSVRYSDE